MSVSVSREYAVFGVRKAARYVKSYPRAVMIYDAICIPKPDIQTPTPKPGLSNLNLKGMNV